MHVSGKVVGLSFPAIIALSSSVCGSEHMGYKAYPYCPCPVEWLQHLLPSFRVLVKESIFWQLGHSRAWPLSQAMPTDRSHEKLRNMNTCVDFSKMIWGAKVITCPNPNPKTQIHIPNPNPSYDHDYNSQWADRMTKLSRRRRLSQLFRESPCCHGCEGAPPPACHRLDIDIHNSLLLQSRHLKESLVPLDA